MEIQERIQSIMQKMDCLSSKRPKYTCGKFPPQWNPPATDEDVRMWEQENDIQLPEDYKQFITTVADGGTQPFYGLNRLLAKPDPYDPFQIIHRKKFLYTVRNPLLCAELSDEEYEALFEPEDEPFKVDTGFIRLCHEGCGMFSILIINTDDPDTYGTVWFYDFASDAGTLPLIDPKTKQPMQFLDWLEYYVDRTLELADDDYFSYCEIAGKVE